MQFLSSIHVFAILTLLYVQDMEEAFHTLLDLSLYLETHLRSMPNQMPQLYVVDYYPSYVLIQKTLVFERLANWAGFQSFRR